jgi:hypothetical protein
MFKSNTKYLIDSPQGFKPFLGINTKVKQTIIISTLNYNLECSLDHRIETNLGDKFSHDLYLGELIRTKIGFEPILSIEKTNIEKIVYDPIEVSGNHYFSGEISSHNCEFLGSGATLINGRFLKILPIRSPKYTQNNFDVYEDPVKTINEPHVYVITVDTARGKQLDYSALCVIDVSSSPYKVVAKYRSNIIPPVLLADLIYPIARKYNNAFVLIELDGPGFQVADDLHFILEYDNILYVATKGRSGQILATGFGHTGKNVQRGLKMSTPVRRTGCANLKTLIENKKLEIYDNDIKNELNSFELKGDKYQAAEGHHDDLVMSLVTFSWLTTQKHFRDLVDSAVREDLLDEYTSNLDHDLTPYGWVETHQEVEEVICTEKDIWKSAQSEVWNQYADRERMKATIDMDKLKRLQDYGWA